MSTLVSNWMKTFQQSFNNSTSYPPHSNQHRASLTWHRCYCLSVKLQLSFAVTVALPCWFAFNLFSLLLNRRRKFGDGSRCGSYSATCHLASSATPKPEADTWPHREGSNTGRFGWAHLQSKAVVVPTHEGWRRQEGATGPVLLNGSILATQGRGTTEQSRMPSNTHIHYILQHTYHFQPFYSVTKPKGNQYEAGMQLCRISYILKTLHIYFFKGLEHQNAYFCSWSIL